MTKYFVMVGGRKVGRAFKTKTSAKKWADRANHRITGANTWERFHFAVKKRR